MRSRRTGAPGRRRACSSASARARRRLHQRPWRLRHRPALAALDRGDGVFMAAGFGDGLPRRATCWAAEPMPRILAALASGLLFGLGLIVSGMVEPGQGARLPRPRRRLGPVASPSSWRRRSRWPRSASGSPGGCRPALRRASRRRRAGDRRAPGRRQRAVRHRLGHRRLLPGAGAGLARLRRLAKACWSSSPRCSAGWGSTTLPSVRDAAARPDPDKRRRGRVDGPEAPKTYGRT